MHDLFSFVGVDRMKSLVDYQVEAIDAVHSPADSDRGLLVVGVTAITPTVGRNLTGADEVDEPLLTA